MKRSAPPEHGLQHEVTDRLGDRGRQAVEVLIQAIDRADRAQGGRLLKGVEERTLYEAAVAVLMRLVFLLYAEERKLLAGPDPALDEHYAVSPVREQLREISDLNGEESLEQRRGTWARLLATFRAVHGGARHQGLVLRAYGGSLFDPDRYPLLEGRAEGTRWPDAEAPPLPVDDRTVLHLLESIRVLEPRGRALDEEQLGTVYEGLLDYTARRAGASPVLGLQGSKNHGAEVPLDELVAAAKRGRGQLVAFLREKTGRSVAALKSALGSRVVEPGGRLLRACGGDECLHARVKPFAALLRDDASGRPVIIPKGSFYVTAGADRRSSGTHYTPPTLTGPLVRQALEPLVYEGPALGKPREEWKLKRADALLALRVCDLTMGSGAFLVQACRYLAARLVEAWKVEEEEAAAGTPLSKPSPDEPEERLLSARRMVAARCLYGVDRDPMAVEMGKLSLWLTTLRRDQPFTFLDHALRCGDSLLGLTELEQVARFAPRPEQGRRAILEVLADLLVGATLASEPRQREAVLAALAREAGGALEARVPEAERKARLKTLARKAEALLQTGREPGQSARRPFHWVLEFPEVFAREDRATRGFDAIIGNPPFSGGTLASAQLSETYTRTLQSLWPPWHGKADFVVGFIKRAAQLAKPAGVVALVATSSIIRGESKDSGLSALVKNGWVLFGARPPYPWPGVASLEVVEVLMARGWRGARHLDRAEVEQIAPDLSLATGSGSAPEALEESLAAYLGVKLSPANPDLPAGAFEKLGRAVFRLTRPALGGAELYQCLDLKAAPRAFAPELVRAGRKVGGGPRWADIKHAAPAVRLQHQLRGARDAFACGETSVHLVFRRVPAQGLILRHKLVVFPANGWETFALLQSAAHVEWAWKWGLRRKADLVYSPKRCARTFPLPLALPGAVASLGERFHETRHAYARARGLGLTQVHGLLHDPAKADRGLAQLRRLYEALSQAVLAAYRWDGLSQERFGFHETPLGVRFTARRAAVEDMLERLLELNNQRYTTARAGRAT